jgi:ankyrin repeat protein
LLCLALVLGASFSARSDEIQKAVIKGDLNKVLELLKDHPDLLEEKNNLGQTPLMVAVNHSQLEIAELLLAKGANVNARDAQMRTPVILALPVYNHGKMMTLLIAKGADVGLEDKWKMSALAYAAQKGQLEDAKILIAKGASVNVITGASPLYFAVMGTHREMVEYLLSHGADANYKFNGRTLLDYAKLENYDTRQMSDPKIEELLTKYSHHEMDANSAAGGDEIHKAVLEGDFKRVVALLRDHPNVLEARNSLGQTPLMEAVNHNRPEIAELLLANGADVNARDMYMHTPLIQAIVISDHFKMLRVLLAKGADVNLADDSSMTAVAYAAKQGQLEDAKILIANDANVNVVTGESPLYMAIRTHRVEMVELLLASGGDANYKVNDQTLLHYAKRSGQPEIKALVEKYGGHE